MLLGEEMKLDAVKISAAAMGLAFFLIASAVMGGILVWGELQRGGIGTKWVFQGTDPAGNDNRYMAAKVLDDGSILAYESGSIQRNLIELDSNGVLKWKAPINAFPGPVPGPDAGWYYVDWPSGDATNAGWRNLTVLDSQGHFRWHYVTSNGSLDLWGIYPDGQVMVHYSSGHYNFSTQKWVREVDKIIALADGGMVLWSMDWTLSDPAERGRLTDNGTLMLNIRNATGSYVMGISKDGAHAYIEKVGSFIGYLQPPSSRNGTTEYQVIKEFNENKTSVTSVYAINITNGERLWGTVLGYADTPDNRSVGSSSVAGAIVDGKGRIYCDDLSSRYSYCLDDRGTILWKKPFLGDMAGVFASGRILVVSPSSIEQINPDGSLVWKHAVRLNGYTTVWPGPNETVYLFTDTSIVSLARTTGFSIDVQLLIVVIAIDGVVVSLFLLIGWRERRARRV